MRIHKLKQQITQIQTRKLRMNQMKIAKSGIESTKMQFINQEIKKNKKACPVIHELVW